MKDRNSIGASASSHVHAEQQQSHDKSEAECGDKRGDDVSGVRHGESTRQGMNCSGKKEAPQRVGA